MYIFTIAGYKLLE